MSEQTPGDPSAVPESRTAQGCLAEEWQRDGRGLWAFRTCRLGPKHEGKHDFWSWVYNVKPPVASALASSASVSSQFCDVIHVETGAHCELPPGHEQNHRGQFDNGIAQWPKAAASSAGQPPRGETDAPLTDVAARLGIPAHTFAVLRSILDGTFTPEAGDGFDYAGEVRARLGVAALHSGLIPALREWLTCNNGSSHYCPNCDNSIDVERFLARFP